MTTVRVKGEHSLLSLEIPVGNRILTKTNMMVDQSCLDGKKKETMKS